MEDTLQVDASFDLGSDILHAMSWSSSNEISNGIESPNNNSNMNGNINTTTNCTTNCTNTGPITKSSSSSSSMTDSNPIKDSNWQRTTQEEPRSSPSVVVRKSTSLTSSASPSALPLPLPSSPSASASASATVALSSITPSESSSFRHLSDQAPVLSLNLNTMHSNSNSYSNSYGGSPRQHPTQQRVAFCDDAYLAEDRGHGRSFDKENSNVHSYSSSFQHPTPSHRRKRSFSDNSHVLPKSVRSTYYQPRQQEGNQSHSHQYRDKVETRHYDNDNTAAFNRRRCFSHTEVIRKDSFTPQKTGMTILTRPRSGSFDSTSTPSPLSPSASATTPTNRISTAIATATSTTPNSQSPNAQLHLPRRICVRQYSPTRDIITPKKDSYSHSLSCSNSFREKNRNHAFYNTSCNSFSTAPTADGGCSHGGGGGSSSSNLGCNSKSSKGAHVMDDDYDYDHHMNSKKRIPPNVMKFLHVPTLQKTTTTSRRRIIPLQVPERNNSTNCNNNSNSNMNMNMNMNTNYTHNSNHTDPTSSTLLSSSSSSSLFVRRRNKQLKPTNRLTRVAMLLFVVLSVIAYTNVSNPRDLGESTLSTLSTIQNTVQGGEGNNGQSQPQQFILEMANHPGEEVVIGGGEGDDINSNTIPSGSISTTSTSSSGSSTTSQIHATNGRKNHRRQRQPILSQANSLSTAQHQNRNIPSKPEVLKKFVLTADDIKKIDSALSDGHKIGGWKPISYFYVLGCISLFVIVAESRMRNR